MGGEEGWGGWWGGGEEEEEEREGKETEMEDGWQGSHGDVLKPKKVSDFETVGRRFSTCRH